MAHDRQRLWTEDEPFDFEGRYYKIKKGELAPKPIQDPHPAIMNAGSSERGRHFAAKHCDVVYTVVRSGGSVDECRAHVAAYRTLARETTAAKSTSGPSPTSSRARPRRRRATSTITTSTRRATGRRRRNVVETFMLDINARNIPPERMQADAGDVHRRLGRLPADRHPRAGRRRPGRRCRSAGLDGVLLCWPRYEQGMREFRDVTYPLVRQAGLRDFAGVT